METEHVNTLCIMASFLLKKGAIEDMREELSPRVCRAKTDRGRRTIIKRWLLKNEERLMHMFASAVLYHWATSPASEN